jgi:hypothetical protein
VVFRPTRNSQASETSWPHPRQSSGRAIRVCCTTRPRAKAPCSFGGFGLVRTLLPLLFAVVRSPVCWTLAPRSQSGRRAPRLLDRRIPSDAAIAPPPSPAMRLWHRRRPRRCGYCTAAIPGDAAVGGPPSPAAALAPGQPQPTAAAEDGRPPRSRTPRMAEGRRPSTRNLPRATTARKARTAPEMLPRPHSRPGDTPGHGHPAARTRWRLLGNLRLSADRRDRRRLHAHPPILALNQDALTIARRIKTPHRSQIPATPKDGQGTSERGYRAVFAETEGSP